MEILPGVHQLLVNYKNRPLQLYLLRFGSESLLMDVGDNGTPVKDILPWFAEMGFDPRMLTYVLLTHPDLDHVGGIHAMKTFAPQAKFLCGTLDRPQIETPEGLAHLRARAHYYWHGLGPDDAKLAAFIENSGGTGKCLPMEQTFSGGETLRLGDKSLTILHLPGHSLGHLGVYLPHENAAIIGDAVHHTAAPFIAGGAALPPTYMWVDAYLGTIARLEAMKLDRLFSCHWPNAMEPAAVARFLEESRAYALRSEQVVLETVQAAGPAGVTLKDVCLLAKTRLGEWPADRDLEARSMVCGHMQRLASQGQIRATDDRPTRYISEETWRGLR